MKWSHLKREISKKIIVFFSKNRVKPKGESDKVLIVTLDALGDNLVKTKTIEIISKFYGANNTYILCKDKWADLYVKLGYQTYIDEYKNLIKRIFLYKKLNKQNFKKIIYFKHDLSEKQEYFFPKDKIVEQAQDKKYNYILEQHIDLLEKLTKEKFSLNDIRPNLKKEFKNSNIKNTISIGIGASNTIRTLPVKKMIEIINLLLKRFPNKEVILLGSGRKQEEYTKEIMRVIKNKNLINKVEKIKLIETLEIVANSDLFIGYDSGLINAAFTFQTKYICLHWGKVETWWHKFENCVTLIGDEKNIEKDETYGTDILNSITISQIEDALDDLKIKN
ncbi:MAG: glycosyltransferase family 9 protein [Cetobacterium sp.]